MADERHQKRRQVPRGESHDGAPAAGNPLRPWPAPAEIRRRAERRRRSRRLAGAGGVVAAAVAVAILVAALPDAPASGPRVRAADRIGNAVEMTAVTREAPGGAGTASEGPVASGEQRFSEDLVARLASADPHGNQVVSPYSLAEVLLMLELGARGPTAEQIAAVLGAPGTSGPQQAAGWHALAADLSRAAAAGHATFHDAASLWTQHGLPLQPAFLASLQQSFGAGVWQADFAHDPVGTVDAVNAWVRAQTGGRITKLLEPSDVDPLTVLALLDAVSFVGQWEWPFSTTAPGTFHAPSASPSVTYLESATARQVPALFGHGVVAVQLPYGVPAGQAPPSAGRFAALAIMPTSSSLPAWLAGLPPGGLASIVAGMTTQPVTVALPQLSLSSRQSLNGTLSALGMNDAFGPTADFSGMSPVETQVHEVVQAATLHVTKWGTAASAATAGISDVTSIEVGRHATFDRPFLFVVRDTVTGAILFEAAVENPAA